MDHPEWVGLAFRPRLVINQEAPEMRMHWPGEFSDAVLESASLMTGTWIAVTNVPTLRSNRVTVLLPPRGSSASVSTELALSGNGCQGGPPSLHA